MAIMQFVHQLLTLFANNDGSVQQEKQRFDKNFVQQKDVTLGSLPQHF